MELLCQTYRAAIFRVVPKPTSVGIIPMHNPTIKIEDAQSPTPCHQIVYESSFNFCASDWWKIFLGKGLFIFFCFYFSSVWSWASLHWLSRCLYFIFCKLYIFLLCWPFVCDISSDISPSFSFAFLTVHLIFYLLVLFFMQSNTLIFDFMALNFIQ